MKPIYFLIFFMLLTFVSKAQDLTVSKSTEMPSCCSKIPVKEKNSKKKKAALSCCEGKCTGSAYCTACTSCEYCAWCNSGGSCGTCGGGNVPKNNNTYRYTATPKHIDKIYKGDSKTLPNITGDRISYYKSKPTYISANTTNVYEYQWNNSSVIIQIPTNRKVKVINSFFGEYWEVYYEGKTGYVLSSDLEFDTQNNTEITENMSSYEKAELGKHPVYICNVVVSLKEEKNEKTAILIQIPQGAKVHVLNSFFGEWWEIAYNGIKGYATKDQLSFDPQNNLNLVNNMSTYELKDIENKPTYISTKQIELKDERSDDSATLIQIPVGAQVKVLESFFGEWWEVSYEGKKGHVRSSYLKKSF
jgi:uncharacterized protein YgiM (DUF1202 family)